jgi:hypothetical protein
VQAELDWKLFNPLSKLINGNIYNTEDMMSIPTSLFKEEAESLLVA